MAPKPLALTDGQMSAVMNAAASLLPRDRDAFLRALAVVLHDAPQPLGHGQVARAIRHAIRPYWRPPETTRETVHRQVVGPAIRVALKFAPRRRAAG